jgi:hypothetical protein
VADRRETNQITNKKTEGKRRNRNATKPVRKRKSASTRPTVKQQAKAVGELWRVVYQFERWAAFEPDLGVSQSAFGTLTDLVHRVLTSMRCIALFPDGSLGALSRHLPENDAWERYRRGEHAAAWAGVELARLYKRIKAQLASRSKRSINPLRDLLYGSKVGKFDMPPNEWFRGEYETKRDYRPTGRMAVWVARKIENIRRLKARRWVSQLCASIKFANDRAKLRPQPETKTDDKLATLFRPPKVVQSDRALKKLDNLPPFGGPGAGAINDWQSFVRHEVLTQKEIITEFESLFPNQRKNLDGTITATLDSAWQAAQGGGDVILPE